jgi:ribonuclease HII
LKAKKKKFKPTLYYEKKFRKKGFKLIIGVDEAGRGPLAGPVVAAAVALKNPSFKNYIDDSKRLTPALREKAYLEIIEKSVFGIGVINEKIIDHLNILTATRIAMENAVIQLLDKIKSYKKKNTQVLVDGNVKLDTDLAVTNIIKGDSRSKSIACASILAKVTRDRIMSLYDKIYPQYEFQKHKGYPTQRHRLALKKFGPSRIHRMSFYGV